MPIVAALVLFLAACAQDVSEGKVEAKVEEVAAAAPAPAPAAGAKVPVDTSRSKVHALGAKITATHPVVFHKWNGSLTLDGESVTGLDIAIDVGSMESDNERLTEHLKKEDFLFVEKHPQATFTSTSVTPGTDVAGMTHTVSGDLTIRGKTKRVTFPAKIATAADAVSASTEFAIDRQDFEVTYPGKPDDLVQDKVVLTIDLVAPRGATGS